MAGLRLPEAVLEKFRRVALPRVELIEQGWTAALQHPEDGYLAQEVHREIHTLKGDSRVVGFRDVNALCQRLEDLFHVAHDRKYHVGPEYDLAVRMGLQFAAALVRSAPGVAVAGIDLPGFFAKVDALVAAERSRRRSEEPPPSRMPGGASPNSVRSVDAPPRLRDELATQATLVYLEALNATGPSETRLLSVWRALATLAVTLGGEDLRARLQRFVPAGEELAREAGKEATVAVDVDEGLVTPEVASAIDLAVLHSLRNAVAHGLESPAERLAHGKPAAGTLHVRVSLQDAFVELDVEDDGRGVDVGSVRRRAVELGFMVPDVAALMQDEDILRLVFRPGFSTAAALTESAGRGVGLDAVQAAVARLGGTISLSPRTGAGSRAHVRVPYVSEVLDVLLLEIPSCRRRIAVPSTWSVAPEGSRATTELALQAALGLSGPPDPRGPRMQIALQRDLTILTLEVLRAPQLARVRRLCPTSIPVEVVRVGDEELLLVRPERLGAPSAVAARPRSRVLLIDDSEIQRDVLRETLEAEAFEVCSVATLEDFREKLATWHPELVVTDVQMPSVTGMDVCRQVRAFSAGSPVPVILVSGFSEKELVELAWSAGADGYVPKSIGPVAIARRVREIFERGRGV